jgi:hypothetical protein
MRERRLANKANKQKNNCINWKVNVACSWWWRKRSRAW